MPPAVFRYRLLYSARMVCVGPPAAKRAKKTNFGMWAGFAGFVFFARPAPRPLAARECGAIAEHAGLRYMHHRKTLTGASAEVDNKQICRHGGAARRLAYEKQAVILRLREGWPALARAQKENRE